MKSKSLYDSKNFLLILAAAAVVMLGTMSYIVYRQNVLVASFDKPTETLKYQSSEDDIDSIEKDSNETNFDDLDKELEDMDKELNSSN